MVDEDVHIDRHPARMRGIDQRLEIRIGAKMRVDLREIGHPIAVIARALLPHRSLHHLVPEHRRQPDRRRAERLYIIAPPDHAYEVADAAKALVAWVLAGGQPVPFETPLYARGLAIPDTDGTTVV